MEKEAGGAVLVHAAAARRAKAQRAAFLRYLRAEGFVAGTFDPWAQWTVDPSRSQADPAHARHLRRLRWCLAGVLAAWLALMAVLVLC